MIRTTGIDHVHLHVSDVERAADFYRDVLGAEEAFRVGDRLVFVSLPERRVVITLDGRPEDERNPVHVGFALAEGGTVDAAVRAVERAGVRSSSVANTRAALPFAYVADPTETSSSSRDEANRPPDNARARVGRTRRTPLAANRSPS